jgi:hypothetical protein
MYDTIVIFLGYYERYSSEILIPIFFIKACIYAAFRNNIGINKTSG